MNSSVYLFFSFDYSYKANIKRDYSKNVREYYFNLIRTIHTHTHIYTNLYVLFNRFNIYEYLFDDHDLCTQINLGATHFGGYETVKCERCCTLNSCIIASLYELIKTLAMFGTVWIRPSMYINNSEVIIQFRCVLYAFSSISSHNIIFRVDKQ